MSLIRIKKEDVIWNYAGNILNIGLNIFILPLLIYFLNEDEIGLWYIFTSINGLVMLLDLGFTPTISRNIAYCLGGAKELRKEGVKNCNKGATPNYPLMSLVYYTSEKIYLIVTLIALLMLGGIGTVYILYLINDIFTWKYILAWVIYMLALLTNIYFSFYSSVLIGCGAISANNKSVIIGRVLQVLVLVLLLVNGVGLVGASGSYLIYTFIYRQCNKFYLKRIDNISTNIKKNKQLASKNELDTIFKLMFPNAFREGIIALAQFLTTQATTILCSLFFSLTETGMYGMTVQIVTVISSVSSVYFSSFQPEMMICYVENNRQRLKQLLSMSNVVYICVYLIMFIGTLMVGVPLISWIKEGYTIDITLLCLMALYFFLFKQHCMYTSFIATSNRLPYTIPFIVTGFLSILLVILLKITFPLLGIYSLVIGQIIAQAVYNNWRWPLFVLNELELSYVELLKSGIYSFFISKNRKF